jgi:hypothetical protein
MTSPLDVARLDELIGERAILTPDGHPISEWSVPVDDILKFMERLTGGSGE